MAPASVDHQLDQLVTSCYPELRRVAQQLLASERSGHTLQATALVHESWMRLRASRDLQLNDRDHLLRLVARTMRRLLVDHAREREAAKRGGSRERLPLDGLDCAVLHEFNGWETIEALETAMGELETEDPMLARIVEAKIYAELTDTEAAAVVGLAMTTFKKRWAFARAWLHAKLEHGT